MSYSQIVGNISSYIGDLTTTVLQEIVNPNKIPTRKLIDAAESDPIASACVNLKAARAMQLMNAKFSIGDKKIENFINGNFETMKGNLPELAGSLSSASAFGHCSAEFAYRKNKTSWELDKFHILNPINLQYRSNKGEIIDIKYNDGGTEKYIPYWKVLHIRSGLPLCFGNKQVYGSAEMIRAYPFIKLKQLIFGEMGIAGRRLATGIVLGQTESGADVTLLDKNGNKISDGNGGYKRISAVKNLAEQIKNIETNSYIVTDKNNSVSALAISAGEQFWNLAINMIDNQILRSFLCPDTIWQQGVAGFGAGGLSTNQLHILDSTINAIVQQIKDQLIEKVIKNLIIWNFGIRKTYGKFEDNKIENQQENNALASNLMQTLSMGLIPQSDIQAMNKLRDLLKLPEITEEQQKGMIQMNSYLQQLQQPPISSTPGMADQPVEQQQSY